jgi:hypothetical protein
VFVELDAFADEHLHRVTHVGLVVPLEVVADRPVAAQHAVGVVFCAAFRPSASNSEDLRFDYARLDAGFEVEPVARLMRCQVGAELLVYERQGADQITILDNSFLVHRFV